MHVYNLHFSHRLGKPLTHTHTPKQSPSNTLIYSQCFVSQRVTWRHLVYKMSPDRNFTHQSPLTPLPPPHPPKPLPSADVQCCRGNVPVPHLQQGWRPYGLFQVSLPRVTMFNTQWLVLLGRRAKCPCHFSGTLIWSTWTSTVLHANKGFCVLKTRTWEHIRRWGIPF